jgi:hypothetical protein
MMTQSHWNLKNNFCFSVVQITCVLKASENIHWSAGSAEIGPLICRRCQTGGDFSSASDKRALSCCLPAEVTAEERNQCSRCHTEGLSDLIGLSVVSSLTQRLNLPAKFACIDYLLLTSLQGIGRKLTNVYMRWKFV